MTIHWNDREQARAWVKAFCEELTRPCVVLLSGGLGSGKTQLVKWFLEELGAGIASSPTFAIHQRYVASEGSIDHVDLYRLKSDADLESSGFWDLFSEPRGLVFVEWADRLPDSVWPTAWKRVNIELNIDPLREEGRAAAITVR